MSTVAYIVAIQLSSVLLVGTNGQAIKSIYYRQMNLQKSILQYLEQNIQSGSIPDVYKKNYQITKRWLNLVSPFGTTSIDLLPAFIVTDHVMSHRDLFNMVRISKTQHLALHILRNHQAYYEKYSKRGNSEGSPEDRCLSDIIKEYCRVVLKVTKHQYHDADEYVTDTVVLSDMLTNFEGEYETMKYLAMTLRTYHGYIAKYQNILIVADVIPFYQNKIEYIFISPYYDEIVDLCENALSRRDYYSTSVCLILINDTDNYSSILKKTALFRDVRSGSELDDVYPYMAAIQRIATFKKEGDYYRLKAWKP